MTTERTIAFVDLAGFTALTDVHGEDAAVDVVHRFTALARDACRDAGADLVTTVGDAVMVAASSTRRWTPLPGLFHAPAAPTPPSWSRSISCKPGVHDHDRQGR